MLWRRASALARLSQSPCCVGGSPPISRTPPGFGLSALFAFSDTTATVILVPSYTMAYLTGEMVWTVPTLAASGAIAASINLQPLSNRTLTEINVDADTDDSGDAGDDHSAVDE